MRFALIVVILFILTAYRCQRSVDGAVDLIAENQDSTKVTANVVSIDFKSTIQPILKTRCTPCHFPGGKMYAKMPFDTATTVTAHKDGILRRIKDPVENEKLKLFLEQTSR